MNLQAEHGSNGGLFKPLRDYILVKPYDMERVTEGGIVIPETVSEKPMKGEVLAVGEGKILKNGTVRPLDVVVGDKIVFSPSGHKPITNSEASGSDLFMIQEASVIGFIE